MRSKKRCICARCAHVWHDYPGLWALLTKPQYEGDPTNGCPRCGSLYWKEEDDQVRD